MTAESMDAFLDRKFTELRRHHWNTAIRILAAIRPVAKMYAWDGARTLDEINQAFAAFRDNKPYEPKP
jgi:hypothetical protein